MTNTSTTEPSRWHPDPLGVVGRVIAGRYRIVGCLARGGMGAVYLARDVDDGLREVVVKLICADESADTVLRFEREARCLTAIRHPNVVRIQEHGRCAEMGLLYIVMDWVRGETLREYLELWGPCPLWTFVELALQILDGVAAAHHARVIHRDLKPSNVMISATAGGALQVTLLDFGLSKVTDPDNPYTDTHDLLGSPMSIAPEQLRGEPSDSRADVYALGVLFYQMLTGRKPYPGKIPSAVFAQQAAGQHVPMAVSLGARHDVPGPVIALVERCLSPDPGRRPRDAVDLRRRLEQSLAKPELAKVNRLGFAVLTAVVCVAAGLCAWVGWW